MPKWLFPMLPIRIIPGRFTTVAMILLAIPSLIQAQGSEFLVAFGAGNAGIWGTEFTISSLSNQSSTVIVSRAPTQLCAPLSGCNVYATLPAYGTTVVNAPPGEGVGAVYVGSIDAPAAPSVLARAYAPSVGAASLELPVFRVAMLISLDPQELAFPGARRGASGRCNLLLANVADPNVFAGEPVVVKVEVLNVDGTPLAVLTVSLDYGQTRFIADAVGSLGVAALDNGQLRVTKEGGQGVVWGVMTIVRPDGSLSISLGTAP